MYAIRSYYAGYERIGARDHVGHVYRANVRARHSRGGVQGVEQRWNGLLAGVTNSTGYTNAEGIDRLGGNSKKIFEVKRQKRSFHAFVELHIEQGGVLDEKGLDIGVVQGIVGIRWWDVTVTGFSNHAGTTPMNKRQDAMLSAAKFTLA